MKCGNLLGINTLIRKLTTIMEIDLALTILRVSLGLTLAAHGYNKFFKGGKIEGTGRWFDSMGMRVLRKGPCILCRMW